MPRKSVEINESPATKVQGQVNMTTNEKVYEWYIPYIYVLIIGLNYYYNNLNCLPFR